MVIWNTCELYATGNMVWKLPTIVNLLQRDLSIMGKSLLSFSAQHEGFWFLCGSHYCMLDSVPPNADTGKKGETQRGKKTPRGGCRRVFAVPSSNMWTICYVVAIEPGREWLGSNTGATTRTMQAQNNVKTNKEWRWPGIDGGMCSLGQQWWVVRTGVMGQK